MANRQDIGHGFTRFTFNESERIALMHIIDKISRDKLLTTLHEYMLAGNFIQLLGNDREDGDYRLSL